MFLQTNMVRQRMAVWLCSCNDFSFVFFSENVAGIPLEIVQTKESLNIPTRLAIPPVAPPSSMKLLRTVKPNHAPISICHHNGITYVGTNGYTVYQMTDDFQQQFISLWDTQYTHSIKTFGSELYVAVCSSNLTKHQIKVFCTAGKFQRMWNVDGRDGTPNNFVWCGDKIIAPGYGKLVVYSHTGQVITSTRIPELTNPWANISSGVDTDIYSEYNKALKVEIYTGKVLWTSTYVSRPGAIVCHNQNVYISAEDDYATRVFILSSETG